MIENVHQSKMDQCHNFREQDSTVLAKLGWWVPRQTDKERKSTSELSILRHNKLRYTTRARQTRLVKVYDNLTVKTQLERDTVVSLSVIPKCQNYANGDLWNGYILLRNIMIFTFIVHYL